MVKYCNGGVLSDNPKAPDHMKGDNDVAFIKPTDNEKELSTRWAPFCSALNQVVETRQPKRDSLTFFLTYVLIMSMKKFQKKTIENNYHIVQIYSSKLAKLQKNFQFWGGAASHSYGLFWTTLIKQNETDNLSHYSNFLFTYKMKSFTLLVINISSIKQNLIITQYYH